MFFLKKNLNVHLISAFIVFLFFYPILYSGFKDAGFMYSGDILGWYLPALIKTHSLLNEFNFSAIDYSLFGGSSDFFISPNFFTYHPLVIFLTFIPFGSIGLKGYVGYFVLICIFHSLISTFFSYKLSRKFLRFDFAQSLLVAITYTFSIQMISSVGQTPFYLSATLVPVISYCLLNVYYSKLITIRLVVFSSFPVVILILSGYLPLALACLAISFFISILILFADSQVIFSSKMPFLEKRFIYSILPLVLGLIFSSPIILDLYLFHQETSSSNVPNLFYSAHQLANRPESIVNISPRFSFYSGKMIEFSTSFGLIFFTTLILFFFNFRPKEINNDLSSFHTKVLGFCFFFFIFILLGTYGDFSPISDLIYYFVPQVGKMHIYQRFLLPGQIFLSIGFAIMLKFLLDKKDLKYFNFLFVISFLVFLFLTYLLVNYPTYVKDHGIKFNLNSYVIFELVCLMLFFISFAFFSYKKLFIFIIFLASLPLMDRMYDYSMNDHKLNKQIDRHPSALNKNTQINVLDFMTSNTDKDFIKYIDLTPMWGPNGTESFSKTFPYYALLHNKRITSLGGFTFYLSAREDYLKLMPINEKIAISPSWKYIFDKDVDYLITTKQDFDNSFLGFYFNLEDTLNMKLNNEVFIISLSDISKKFKENNSVFDNGVFSIKYLNELDQKKNIALSAFPSQSSTLGNYSANLATDGTLDGDFKHSSVTHTNPEKNPWIQLDLNASKIIDGIKIYSRTDCCLERSDDLWLLISNDPFSENVMKDMDNPNVWKAKLYNPFPNEFFKVPKVEGRYVRLLINNNKLDNYLSVAEVEVFINDSKDVVKHETINNVNLDIKNFNFNYANKIDFVFNLDQPTILNYQFHDNPRLKAKINDKKINIKSLADDGVKLHAGEHHIKIVYHDIKKVLIWIFLAIYYLLIFTVLFHRRLGMKILK